MLWHFSKALADTEKEREKLFRDIVMSEMTIKEIAEKYDFTVNYISSFLQKNFDKTPTELRGKHNPKIIYRYNQ